MKSVENGVIRTLSPSMMDCFDDTTPFGCQRRFVMRYVYGYKEPQNDSMVDGNALHAMNQTYLQEDKLLVSVQKHTDWFNAGKSFVDSIRPRVLDVEAKVDLLVGGIPIHEMSKCDVVLDDGIVDWKTTSSISKWGKTPGQLAKNNQLVIYAKAFHPTLDKVVLIHGQYQTKEKVLFKTVSVEVSRQELDAHYETVILPLVDRMKEVAKTEANEAALKAVKPNRNACRLNTKNPCPHAAICPADKENPLMNLFNKYKAPAADAAPSTPSGPAVLPPDAPKSNPELAAKPVEGFSPIPPPRKSMKITDVVPEVPSDDEEAAALAALAAIKARKEAAKKAAEEAAIAAKKADAERERAIKESNEPATETEAEKKARGPGRPPGAKNKRTLALEAATEAGVVFESVTVTMGITRNMGDFNSVRFDVSMTAKHGPDDRESAFAQVEAEVKQRIETELARLGGGK